MRLLLDTATLIYAVESPERLRQRAAAAIRNPDNILELSAISVVEIAINTGLGKLIFPVDALQLAIQSLDVRLLSYTADHAIALFGLPAHHSDPFDRQLIAQALCEKIPVVTPDEKFSLYKGLKIIW